MISAPRDFPELHFYNRAFRLAKILSFVVFFALLATSLSGGNIFLDYTLALENGQAETILSAPPPPQIYDSVYAAFQTESDQAIERLQLDVLPEMDLPPDPIGRIAAQKKIGVYIHMNNVANHKVLKAEIAKLQKLQNAAIVFDVKGSFVYFSSDSAIAKKYGLIKPLYDLPKIIAELQEAGIYTIARVIAIKDPQLAFKNSSTWLKNPWTGQPALEWVDPTDAEVLEYNHEVIAEIVAAGIDEINLDFIRYPDKFTSAFLGLTGEQKIHNILNFVQMVRDTINAQKRNTILSLDTFAVIPWEDANQTARALGQDVRKLAELADIIAPMLYPSTFSRDNQKYYATGTSFEYSTVYLSLKKYARLLGSENAKKLRPWIQGFYTTTKQMRDQISAVFDAGFCGFTVWDIQNDYSETYKILGEIGVPTNCQA
ncbi:MAG: putative glycoside hydrolase [Patescibacteria group bacterium]